MSTAPTALSFFASIKRPGLGYVIVRAKRGRRVEVTQWSPGLSLQIADAMRLSLYDADARSRGTVELNVFGNGVVLDVELAHVEAVADDLTRAACRASGVRA